MKQHLTLLFAACVAHAAQAQTCLVAYYPFTGNAVDASGNGHNGLVSGAVLAHDRFGNVNAAYRFDGVDDFIDIGSDPALGRASTDFTVAAWMNLDAWSTVRATLITNRDGSTDTSGTHIGVAGAEDPGPGYDEGELSITCATPNVLCADTAISLVAWHHVAISYDRTNAWVTFYYNGLPASEGPLANFLEKAYVHHTIGSAPFEGAGIYPLDGRLDEVALFNCALSDAEILDLFNGSFPLSIADVPGTQLPLLYPVPTTDRLVLPASFTADLDGVRVLDMRGLDVPVTVNNGELDVRGLPQGSYVLQLVSRGERYQARFQKL